MTEPRPVIAIIGGTGALGGGLARRWVKAGYPVVVGSRAAEKAVEAARALPSATGASPARGMANKEAAAAAEVVVLAVPYSNHDAIVAEIKDVLTGKIVIDTTVPLQPPKVGTVQIPNGSIAVATQRMLGPNARVVSACQNVAAHKLQADGPIDCDVLVCGNDKDARETVIGLLAAIGLRGLHAGPLANSLAQEALTSVLITLNKRYGIDGAGIRITGVPATGGE